MLDFSERFLPQGRLDGKIQKPRPDDLHAFEELIRLRKILDDDLCNIVGRSLLRGCQGHGHGRGEISPFRPFGATTLAPNARKSLALKEKFNLAL